MKTTRSKLWQTFEAVCLAGALGLVLVIAWASYQAWMSYNVQREQMLIAAAVRISSMGLQSALKDVEAGQRGFLLTGEVRYLEPYQDAIRRIPELMTRLTSVTATRPVQRARLGQLRPLIANQLAEVRQTIELRRDQRTDAALAILRTGQGKAAMDEIRTVCEAMEITATDRYRELAQGVESTIKRLGLISTAGSLALFALLVMAAVTIHRGLRRRQMLMASLESSERETREARDWLQTTLRSIGDGVIATDPKGRITFLNGVAQELTGWSQESAAGADLAEVFVITNEKTGEIVENPAFRALREGRVVGLANHTKLTAKDGKAVPIEDSAAPIRDEHGEVTGAVLVFRDATERQQAERAMEQSVKQFRVMADHAPVLVWIAGPDRRATWFNQPWLEFAGRSLEHELKHDPADSEHPEDHERCVGMYSEAFAARKPFTIEYRLRRRDGEYRWMLSKGAPLYGLRHEFSGFIGSCTDITDQKAVEEELVRANDDLSQFAFAASHDLQEPLRMIASYSQLLVSGYREGLTEEADMCVRFITEGTRRMSELLTDLLAYTGVGEQDARPDEWVDLDTTFATAVANLRTAIEESGAIVSSGPLPTVNGHQGHFTQLLQNLLSNAIKYRAKEPLKVKISAQRQGAEWQLTVEDNGIGIDPPYQDKIFGVFKRLHGKEISGTGIGLAICQRVVERYGGRIWVESKLGQGSKFHFTLPVEKEST